MKRQVYIIDKAGAIDDLKLEAQELPDPGRDEATIEVKAIGLNFADIFAIKGLYKAAPKTNFIPGLEYAGKVIKTGSNVKELKAGDRIMGVTKFGAYVSHLNINAKYVFPLPEDWNFEQGAAFLVQVLTAYYGLKELGAISQNNTVLIHSAAGGVGTWANRIAKKYNCYTIGTVGNSDKVEYCKKEGYDKVIVRDTKHFKEQLKENLEERDLNLVMDSIGGKIFKDSYVVMAPQGRIIVYGSARYTTYGSKANIFKLLYHYIRRPKVDPQSMTNYNKSVMGFNLIYLYEKANLMKHLLKEIDQLNLSSPEIGEIFNYSDLHNAIYSFQSGKTKGKIVLKT